jgi:antitoxin ParD1/3/4
MDSSDILILKGTADASMNVHLTPELETLVHNKVKTGRYNSASEVVRDALRLFEQRDRVRELQIRGLQKKINEGWASHERGEGLDGEEFFRRNHSSRAWRP